MEAEKHKMQALAQLHGTSLLLPPDLRHVFNLLHPLHAQESQEVQGLSQRTAGKPALPHRQMFWGSRNQCDVVCRCSERQRAR